MFEHKGHAEQTFERSLLARAPPARSAARPSTMARMSPEASSTEALLRRLDLPAAWRADVETARADLDATPTQAFLVAAHALAWRASALTLPVALLLAGSRVMRGEADVVALLLAAATGSLGPQLLTTLLTVPVEWVATVQAWVGESRTAQVRFGLVNLAYPYYGWRYAYRGRRRPWGALTREERLQVDPIRAGGAPSASQP